jgi:serine/threonine protein kinase
LATNEVTAVVADFGLSVSVNPEVSEIQATWQWLPPEAISSDSSSKFNETADVYSYGMVLYVRGFVLELVVNMYLRKLYLASFHLQNAQILSKPKFNMSTQKKLLKLKSFLCTDLGEGTKTS